MAHTGGRRLAPPPASLHDRSQRLRRPREAHPDTFTVSPMDQPPCPHMELERSGGQVPTLRPRYAVTPDSLTPGQCRELERLLAAADFFRLPARFSTTGLPDTFEYRLTATSGSQSHTVVYHDADGHPEPLDAIAEFVRRHQK